MAITVSPKITGQMANSTNTYCYLFEPLPVSIYDSSATKIYIDVTLYDSQSGYTAGSYIKFAEYDTTGNPIEVDLMAIAKQVLDIDVWKFSDVSGMDVGTDGYLSVVPANWVKFTIYSDVSSAVYVKKNPIFGGRDFHAFQMNPEVTYNSPLTEFEYLSLSTSDLRNRFPMSALLGVTLPDISSSVDVPTLTKYVPSPTPDNHIPCGGVLLWKSRFGGWMFWGFDIMTKTNTSSTNGNINVNLFEPASGSSGRPHVSTDYSQIDNSYTITLKSLGLSADELEAVSGIRSSMAVYFQHPQQHYLELMKLTSVSAPRANLANGGDFSVSLQSISKSTFLTR